jgi:hypothetical protein
MNTAKRTVLKLPSLKPKATAVALLSCLVLAACGEDPPADHASEPRPHIYVYGEKIGFGFGGDWMRFKGNGWAEGEQDFVWTKGLGAWMQVRVAASDEPVTLRMKLSGMINAPRLPFQPVTVSVNRRKIATWKVGTLREYTATIPRDIVAPVPGANPAGITPVLLIDLYTPESISPSELNIGRDPRRLGICVWEASMTPGLVAEGEAEPEPKTPEGSPYDLGTPILFGEKTNSGFYKLTGWYAPDSSYIWIGKTPSTLGLRIDPPQRPLRMKASLVGLVKPPKLMAQQMDVLVNGEKIASWQVGAEMQEFTATIPPELAASGVLRVELSCPTAVSPNTLQLGGDLRQLGVQIHRLEIDEAL